MEIPCAVIAMQKDSYSNKRGKKHTRYPSSFRGRISGYGAAHYTPHDPRFSLVSPRDFTYPSRVDHNGTCLDVGLSTHNLGNGISNT